MTDAAFRKVVLGQFLAALAMHEECIRRCPPKQWAGTIGTYPFWQVAYHALCFVDLYSASSNEAWTPHEEHHPAGRDELRREYPSRVFTKKELLAYTDYCRRKVKDSLRKETAASFRRASGFSWVPMTRAELPIYSLRHLQHHTGQLSAFLRRTKVGVRWRYSGER